MFNYPGVHRLSATADNTSNNRAGKGGTTPQRIHSRTKCRPIYSRFHAFLDRPKMPEVCEPGFTTQDEFEVLVSASSCLCPPFLFLAVLLVLCRIYLCLYMCRLSKRRNTYTHIHIHTHTHTHTHTYTHTHTRTHTHNKESTHKRQKTPDK
jgi:hypothetical protein